MTFNYHRIGDSLLPTSNQRLKRLVLSYAPDWILIGVLSAILLSLDHVDGFRRRFSVSDPTISFPHAEHVRVPNWLLYTLSIGVPAVIQPLTNYFSLRSWWDLHTSWLALGLSISLNNSITAIVKISVGRPRPDLLSRCRPPSDAIDPPFELSDSSICSTFSDGSSLLRDGFRSFPSGHSSTSFAGLGFLAFYLAGKLGLFNGRPRTAKPWIVFVPFCAAAMVAISRTMDYRHHWHDVVAGSLLGALTAYFCYRQYYPHLGSPNSRYPFPPRIDVDAEDGDGERNTSLPTHNVSRDVEAIELSHTQRP